VVVKLLLFAQPSVSNVGAEVNNSECTELGRWRQIWKEVSERN